MLSSISSSNNKAPLATSRPVFGWLAVILAILLGLEIITRAGFDRISNLQKRMAGDRATLASELTSAGDRPTILMAGNSLLLEGVDFEALRQALDSRARTYRYIVTQTVYFDWYYGLRRLFAEGIRPTYLLFGISSSHLVRSSIRGDYSAYYLFDLPGLVEYASREKVDLTTASSLVFAHFSKLYGVRSEIRATLIEKVLPSYADALHAMTGRPEKAANSFDLESVAVGRLRDLDRLCRINGVRLIFILPPTETRSEFPILAAGEEARVPVLLPVSRASLSDSHFSDGFHLNQEGRAIFTRALIRNVKAMLPEKPGGQSIERYPDFKAESKPPFSGSAEKSGRKRDLRCCGE